MSLFFLFIFGLLVLLATVDLEPYFAPQNKSAFLPSEPGTAADAALSLPNDEGAKPANGSPSKITTHRLIVTENGMEGGKSEQKDGQQVPAATTTQTGADPIDGTITVPAHGDRP